MTIVRSTLCIAATLIASLTAALPAAAANVPDGLVTGNAQVCESMSKNAKARSLDPEMPADDAKVPAYCSCVSKTYWSSVPQADFDAMMAEQQAGTMGGPKSKALSSKVHERMAAARKACH